MRWTWDCKEKDQLAARAVIELTTCRHPSHSTTLPPDNATLSGVVYWYYLSQLFIIKCQQSWILCIKFDFNNRTWLASCKITLRIPAKSNQNSEFVNFSINRSLEDDHIIHVTWRTPPHSNSLGSVRNHLPQITSAYFFLQKLCICRVQSENRWATCTHWQTTNGSAGTFSAYRLVYNISLKKKETNQRVYGISNLCKRLICGLTTVHGKMYAKVLTEDIICDLFVSHFVKVQACLPHRTELLLFSSHFTYTGLLASAWSVWNFSPPST